MRGGTVLPTRPAWFDRAATNQANAYNSGAIAPHAETSRFSYTVPSARKAIAEMLFVEAIRVTAAAPVGADKANIYYTPSGGAAGRVFRVADINNTVGNVSRQTVGESLFLYAGDVIEGRTEDTSTGGTVEYTLAAKFSEFSS